MYTALLTLESQPPYSIKRESVFPNVSAIEKNYIHLHLRRNIFVR